MKTSTTTLFATALLLIACDNKEESQAEQEVTACPFVTEPLDCGKRYKVEEFDDHNELTEEQRRASEHLLLPTVCTLHGEDGGAGDIKPGIDTNAATLLKLVTFVTGAANPACEAKSTPIPWFSMLETCGREAGIILDDENFTPEEIVTPELANTWANRALAYRGLPPRENHFKVTNGVILKGDAIVAAAKLDPCYTSP